MAADGKRQHLLEKIVEPLCSSRKMHRSGLDACGLRVHSNRLLFLWPNSNRVDVFPLEILDQRHARAHFFYQKGIIVCIGFPSVVEFKHLALEVGILETVAEHVEHIDAFATDLKDYADRIARKLPCTQRSIPTHDRHIAWRGAGRLLICGEPIALYEIRGGPGCLNSLSASISGASAGVRLPCGGAAGGSRRDRVWCRQGSSAAGGDCRSRGSTQSMRAPRTRCRRTPPRT